jgi:hypothetical protein
LVRSTDPVWYSWKTILLLMDFFLEKL